MAATSTNSSYDSVAALNKAASSTVLEGTYDPLETFKNPVAYDPDFSTFGVQIDPAKKSKYVPADYDKALLVTSLYGEASPEAVAKVTDWRTLTRDVFALKYGEKELANMEQQEAVLDLFRSAQVADNYSGGLAAFKKSTDAVRDFLTGAITAGISTGEFLNRVSPTPHQLIPGAKDFISNGLANLNALVSSASENAKTDMARAADIANKIESIANKARLDREFQEDIANGASYLEAASAREAKDFVHTLVAYPETGKWREGVAQGLGSIAEAIFGTGLTRKGLEIGGKALLKHSPNLAKTGINFFKNSPDIVQGGIKATPWAINAGAPEAGGDALEIKKEILDTSPQTLREKSPIYSKLVDQVKAEGVSNETLAENIARERLAEQAASEVFWRKFFVATALNYATAPLEKLGKASSAKKASLGAMGEFVEESGGAGVGTISMNEVRQRYTNKDQQLHEGVGKAMAEEGFSALGPSAPHVAGSTLHALAINGYGSVEARHVAKKASDYLEKLSERTSNSADLDDKTKTNTVAVVNEVKKRVDSYNSWKEQQDLKTDDKKDPVQQLSELTSLYTSFNENQLDTKDTDASTVNAAQKENKTLLNTARKELGKLQEQVQEELARLEKEYKNKPIDEETAKRILNIQEALGTSAQFAHITQEQAEGLTKSLDNLVSKIDASSIKDKNLKQAVEQQQYFLAQQNNDEATGIENSFDDDAKNFWTKQTDNVVEIGGKDQGSSNKKAIYTRPGTNPDRFNGQKLVQITDPEGGKVLGKFYTNDGSEYIYTENGYQRRIKAPSSTAKDAGLEAWTKDTLAVNPNDFSNAKGIPVSGILSPDLQNKLTQAGYTNLRFSSKNGVTTLMGDKDGKVVPPRVKDVFSEDELNIFGYNPEDTFSFNNSKKLTKEHILFRGQKDSSGHLIPSSNEAVIYTEKENAPTTSDKAIQEDVEEIAKEKINADEKIGRYCRSLLNNVKTPAQIRRVLDTFRKEAKKHGFALSTDASGNVAFHKLDTNRQENFENIFGLGLSKLFTPVTRLISLWDTRNNSVDPVKTLVEELLNESTLRNFAKLSGQTNVETLIQTIWAGRKYDPKVSNEIPSDDMSLYMQIKQALNREGPLFKGINEALDKVFDKDKFEALNGTVHNGKVLDTTVKDLLTIAAIQWIAKLAVQSHDLTEQEVTNLGLDPRTVIEANEDLEVPFNGVPTQFAIQHLMTDITKFFGVAINNETNRDEALKCLKELAQLTAEAVENAGFITTATETLTYQEKENNDTVTKTKEIPVVLPMRYDPDAGLNGPDLRRLFRAHPTILEDLVTHKLKNSVHFKAPQAKTTIAHTAIDLSKEQYAHVDASNNQAFEFNLPFVNFVDAIDGLSGLSLILYGVDTTNFQNKQFFNKDAWQRIEGQLITHKLAMDYLDTVRKIKVNPKLSNEAKQKELQKVQVYFSNVMLKNGRIMQEGAATWQSNKLLRELLNLVSKETYDLSKTDTSNQAYKDWLITLAQTLGEKVGDKQFSTYETKITDFVKGVEKLVQNSEFNHIFDKIMRGEKCNEKEILAFRDFYRTVDGNKGYGAKINSWLAINGFIEAVRFAKASDAEKAKWRPRIYLETDAKSSGPSLINRMLTPGSGLFTEEFFKTSYRTGNMYGVNATTQQVIDPKNKDEAAILNGSTDPYVEAAQRTVPQRLQEILSTAKEAPDARTKRIIEDSFKDMLTLFKAAGWLDESANDIEGFIKGNKEAIKFTRDGVKKAFQIIPYGSQAKGTTKATLFLMLRQLNTEISKNIAEVYSASGLPESKLIYDAMKNFDEGESWIIDTETTGVDVNNDHIVQISLKKIVAGKDKNQPHITLLIDRGKLGENGFTLPATLNGAVNPLIDVYKKAYEATYGKENPGTLTEDSPELNLLVTKGGTSTRLVSKAAALKLVGKLLKGKHIYGHNIRAFDMPLLQRELATVGIKFDTEPTIHDTLELSRLILKDVKRDRLETVFNQLYPQDILLSDNSQHLADTDVKMTYKILASKGENSFYQAYQLAEKDLADSSATSKSAKAYKGFSANGVSWDELYGALNNLMGTSYQKETGLWTVSGEDISKGVKHTPRAFPNPFSVAKDQFIPSRRSKVPSKTISGDEDIIQNMQITPKGLSHMTELFTPLLGEALQQGITDVLGETPMKNNRMLMGATELLTILARGFEATELENTKENETSSTDLYVIEQMADTNVGPKFTLQSGNQYIVKKQRNISETISEEEKQKFGKFATTPSHQFRTTSSVAGAANWAHAHDGSILLESMPLAYRKGLNISSIHDSQYSSLGNAAAVAANINKATDAVYQKERPYSLMLNRLNEVGQFLHDRYKLGSNAQEAIQIALTRLDKGKTFDDKPITKELLRKSLYTKGNPSDHTFNKHSINNALQNYATGVLEDRGNTLTLFPSRIEKQTVHRKYAKDSSTIKSTFQNFYDEIKNGALREEAFNRILSTFPRHIQHYSALEVGYNVGDIAGLTPEKIQELTDKVNSFSNTYFTWAEIMARYANMRLIRYLNAKTTSKETKSAFKEVSLTGLCLKAQNLLDKEIPFVKQTSGVKSLSQNLYTQGTISTNFDNQSKSEQKLTKQKLANIINIVKRQFRRASKEDQEIIEIFNNIFSTVKDVLLSKQTSLVMVPDLDTLRVQLSNVLFNPNTNGYYDPDTNTIYVVDQDPLNTANWENPLNAQILVHEAIHAIMGNAVAEYFALKAEIENPNGISAQRLKEIRGNAKYRAIDSFYKLTNRLLDSKFNKSGKKAEPEIIKNLRKILIETRDNFGEAVMLDEAFAYLNSNAELYKLLQEAVKLDSHEKKSFRESFKALLENCRETLKYIWKQFFHIDLNKASLESSPAWTFTKAYGLNTLVAIKAEQHTPSPKAPNPKGRFSKNLDKVTQKKTTPLEMAIQRIIYQNTSIASLMDNPKIQEKIQREIEQLIQSKEIFKRAIDNIFKNIYGENYDWNLLKDFAWLSLNNGLKVNERFALQQLKASILKQIDETSFAEDKNNPEDLARSRELYELLTGEHPSLKDLPPAPNLINKDAIQLAMFFSLVKNDSRINKVADTISIEPFDRVTTAKEKTLANTVQKVGNAIINRLAEKELPKTPASKLVTQYIERLESDFQESAGQFELFARNLANFSDSVISAAFRNTVYALAGLEKATITVTGKDSVTDPSGLRKNLKDLEKLRRISPESAYTTLSEGLRNLFNTVFDPDKPWQKFIASHLQEVVGRTASNTAAQTLLKRNKGHLDKTRQLKLEQIPKKLKEAFKKNKITKKVLQHLDRALRVTDISVFTFTEARDYISDKQKCQDKIKDLETKLTTINPKVANLWIQKSKQLAGYLTGNAEAGKNLLTNASLIARLFGENIVSPKIDSTIEHQIDMLVSLYTIESMPETTRETVAQLYATDAQAMEDLHDHIRALYEKEQKRVSERDAFNRLKGWMPRENLNHRNYLIIPKSMLKHFKELGYHSLGKYEQSNIDSSEEMIRIYSDYPHSREAQEGALQSIKQTAFGFNISDSSRNETEGTSVRDPDVFRKLAKKYKSSVSGLDAIPIYSTTGRVIGFDRAIPMEDRHFLAEGRNIFEAIAKYIERQEREQMAPDMNEEAAELAFEDYNNASAQERKTQFIDVPNSNDRNVVEAFNRLPEETKQALYDKFGEGHFYLRKDLVDTYVGYYKASLGDMWEHKSFLPNKAEDVITAMLDTFLGVNARHKVMLAEGVLAGVASYARDTIVVRSVIIPTVNFVTNILVLHYTLGIPITELPRIYRQVYLATEQYNDLFNKQQKLVYAYKTEKNDNRRYKLEKAINDIKKQIKENPLYPLISNGEYATISSQGRIFEEWEFTKQKLGDQIDSLVAKTPNFAQETVKNVLMTKDSATYQTMLKFVNYGDWMAKATTYLYLTNQTKTKPQREVNADLAKNIASILFVDYDQFVPRDREYLNRMGVTHFMTFKYRMIPAALLSLTLNPSRTVLGTLIAGMIGVGSPLADNVLTKVFGGGLSYSLGFGLIFRGILMHPLFWLL